MTNLQDAAASPSPASSPPRRSAPPRPPRPRPPTRAERCETIEQFEARFREIEERRGYEAAVAWWDKRWPKYHDTCLLP